MTKPDIPEGPYQHQGSYSLQDRCGNDIVRFTWAAGYLFDREALVRIFALAPELLEASVEVDALLENLWDSVDWGKTFQLDIKRLNEAPMRLKAVLAKATKEPT